MGKPTIKDVAREADVSIATISRVINSRGGVSEETRKKVRCAIEITGYRHNNIGRMLKTSRTKTIGVLVPTLINPIFSSIVESIQWNADRFGYKTLLTSSGYDPQREISAINSLLESCVDGLILTVGDKTHSTALRIVRNSSIPFVLVFNPETRTDYSTITINNKAAARAIVRKLINFGHKNIGLILGQTQLSDRSGLRREGYRHATKEAGLSRSLELEVAFDQLDMTAACQKMLEHKPTITAVFCSTDMLAIRTIHGFFELGAQVPKDIAVAGFDGIETGRWITPSLATVEQPVQEMGAKAVQHLVEDRIEANGPPLNLTLGYTIRPGASWKKPVNRYSSHRWLLAET